MSGKNKIPLKKRSCPICGYAKSTLLHIQKFSSSYPHKIVSCHFCGFVYVSKTPLQTYYSSYYQDSSIYDETHYEDFHKAESRWIRSVSNSHDHILDIGSSDGHLLSLLKSAGYKHLTGLDPSSISRKKAKEKYGITVITADLYSYQSAKLYDTVIYSAVLEHLKNVKTAIKKATKMLTSKGQIFICVPDAGNFYKKFDEPFGEFSLEHINFFSAASLYFLMKDFECTLLESDGSTLYSSWKKQGGMLNSMKKYINRSNEKMKLLDHSLSKIDTQIIIWGAGSLTQRLLETTNLSHKTRFLVDKNPKFHGKMMKNLPIHPPRILKKYKEPILIASYRYKIDIQKTIKNWNLKNKILTLP